MLTSRTREFGSRRTKQRFDPRAQLVRQRYRRFEQHPPPRWRRRCSRTVEAKPGGGVDELSVTVDEVRDPKGAVTQEDRHFAPCSAAQNLTLDRACVVAIHVEVYQRPGTRQQMDDAYMLPGSVALRLKNLQFQCACGKLPE